MSKAVLSSVVAAVSILLATTAMAANPPGKSGTANPGQAVIAQVVDPADYAAPARYPVVARIKPDESVAPVEVPAEALAAKADADEYEARQVAALMAQGYSENNELKVEATPQRRGNAFVRDGQPYGLRFVRARPVGKGNRAGRCAVVDVGARLSSRSSRRGPDSGIPPPESGPVFFTVVFSAEIYSAANPRAVNVT
jgi:hypothetical protein